MLLVVASGCDAGGVSDGPFGPESAAGGLGFSTSFDGPSMSDSYVRATVTVEFDATIASDSPVYNAETGLMTTQMPLDSPPERLSVEMGYDSWGRFVYDQVALDPTAEPDEVRRVRVVDGVFEMYDVGGRLIVSGDPPPTLHSVFGTSSSDPLVVTDGVVVESFPQPGPSSQVQSSDGSTATVTDVQHSGSVVTVSSVIDPADPSLADLPQRRTYVAAGSEYVLSTVETHVAAATEGSRLTGRSVVRFENVTWSRNEARDDARRSGSDERPWGQAEVGVSPQSMPPDGCDPYGSPSGGTGTISDDQGQCPPFDPWSPPDTPPQPPPAPSGCPLEGGGASLVYVHGILSDGAAWGSPSAGTGPSGGVIGPVRCALSIASEAAPSLTRGGDKGLGGHAEQAAQLYEDVQGRALSNPIFVAHSQGGLVSRRAARRRHAQGAAVRAVITTGTPHRGAPIANTLSPGSGLNTLVNAVAPGGSACRFGDCGRIRNGLAALRDFLNQISTSPAIADLRPSSGAIMELRDVQDPFPSYGIQNEIPRKWAFAQVAGDLTFSNSGESLRRTVRNVNGIATAAAVIGGIGSFFCPWAAPVAVLGGLVRTVLKAADLYWTRVTVGGDQGDGIVPYTSQVHPGAQRNYRAPNPVSHTAEIDTKKSAEAIETVLRDNVGVGRPAS